MQVSYRRGVVTSPPAKNNNQRMSTQTDGKCMCETGSAKTTTVKITEQQGREKMPNDNIVHIPLSFILLTEG